MSCVWCTAASLEKKSCTTPCILCERLALSAELIMRFNLQNLEDVDLKNKLLTYLLRLRCQDLLYLFFIRKTKKLNENYIQLIHRCRELDMGKWQAQNY
jgi:hypothetical protein